MSSKNTLPSVDLMYCQHGGEVIPSIAIERIISLRDEGTLADGKVSIIRIDSANRQVFTTEGVIR
ncbi:hypothetical protein [Klebsiella aerogenes]|uniref:hypothetical protein n=1 Tax=Klebsiella aerogenes TaxID=548 RepID=UPI00378B167C